MRVLCENAASTELRLKAGLGVPSLPGAAGMWLGAQQEAQLVCVSKGQPHDRREQCWSPAPCVLNALTVPLSLPTMDTLYAMSAL